MRESLVPDGWAHVDINILENRDFHHKYHIPNSQLLYFKLYITSTFLNRVRQLLAIFFFRGYDDWTFTVSIISVLTTIVCSCSSYKHNGTNKRRHWWFEAIDTTIGATSGTTGEGIIRKDKARWVEDDFNGSSRSRYVKSRYRDASIPAANKAILSMFSRCGMVSIVLLNGHWQTYWEWYLTCTNRAPMNFG